MIPTVIPKEVMEVILYSKNECQWCDRAKMLFDNLDVQYKEYKYERDFTKPQFYAEFGEGATFPQVVIDGMIMGGCNDTIEYLTSIGCLQEEKDMECMV